jgi:hypothetical protein
VSIYIVTGKLGNGKTLSAVGRIRDYIEQGRRVATNLDLKLDKYPDPRYRNADVIRLPDKPSYADMVALGKGTDETAYDENRFGLLVLDECGTWFNSRNWNEPGRKELNDWFLHSRKLAWDVIIIIQNIEILDKQARDCLAEFTVFCRRMDNLSIPVIGQLWKFATGKRLTLPRVHLGIVKYGTNPQSLTADRWVYRGNDLFDFYDTRQVFLSDSCGMYSYLTPWHLVGRYLPSLDRWRYIKYLALLPLRLAAYSTLLLAAGVLGRSPDTLAKAWGRGVLS